MQGNCSPIYGHNPYQSITVIALNATMFLKFRHLSQYTHAQVLQFCCLSLHTYAQPLAMVDYINEQITLGATISSYI